MNGPGSLAQTAATASNVGRPKKFTPERIQQITNLVERGKSPSEIADIIGVPIGSLAVTCSRLGISLRRPLVKNGLRLLRAAKPYPAACTDLCVAEKFKARRGPVSTGHACRRDRDVERGAQAGLGRIHDPNEIQWKGAHASAAAYSGHDQASGSRSRGPKLEDG